MDLGEWKDIYSGAVAAHALHTCIASWCLPTSKYTFDASMKEQWKGKEVKGRGGWGGWGNTKGR